MGTGKARGKAAGAAAMLAWLALLPAPAMAQAEAKGPAPVPAPAAQGERPPAMYKALQPPIKGPLAAVSADPRDFNGFWWPDYTYSRVFPLNTETLPPFTPVGAVLAKYRIDMVKKATPVPDAAVLCRPMGPRAMTSPYGTEVAQNKDTLVLVFEESHNTRFIHIGGAHPAHLLPTYAGHSIGHWEGDTLVVDTIGFNDKTWLDPNGTPHSDKLHMTERMRKIEGGARLEDTITIDDPVMYTHPFSYRVVRQWRPDKQPEEYICETNMHDAEITKAFHDMTLDEARREAQR